MLHVRHWNLPVFSTLPTRAGMFFFEAFPTDSRMSSVKEISGSSDSPTPADPYRPSVANGQGPIFSDVGQGGFVALVDHPEIQRRPGSCSVMDPDGRAICHAACPLGIDACNKVGSVAAAQEPHPPDGGGAAYCESNEKSASRVGRAPICRFCRPCVPCRVRIGP